ncbi:hypothetical protein [Streptomyces olivaceoviridis]|uniref:hypothetical protein n=1 Tax=Streptomyces olivaceoviridis TaxID=1921 RepID=UPI0033195AEA
MRIRTIRCTACDTYNRAYRITCMVCARALPQIATARARASQSAFRIARAALYLGYGIAVLILLESALRHGGPDRSAGLTAIAAMGFGHGHAVLAEALARRLHPGPDWKKATKVLRQLAADLAEDTAHRVDDLDRHGGIEPVAFILAAIGKRAETDSADAARFGDADEARHQDQVREVSYAAVDHLLADQARRADWQ